MIIDTSKDILQQYQSQMNDVSFNLLNPDFYYEAAWRTWTYDTDFYIGVYISGWPQLNFYYDNNDLISINYFDVNYLRDFDYFLRQHAGEQFIINAHKNLAQKIIDFCEMIKKVPN